MNTLGAVILMVGSALLAGKIKKLVIKKENSK
jgi:hypothetical protein